LTYGYIHIFHCVHHIKCLETCYNVCDIFVFIAWKLGFRALHEQNTLFHSCPFTIIPLDCSTSYLIYYSTPYLLYSHDISILTMLWSLTLQNFYLFNLCVGVTRRVKITLIMERNYNCDYHHWYHFFPFKKVVNKFLNFVNICVHKAWNFQPLFSFLLTIITNI